MASMISFLEVLLGSSFFCRSAATQLPHGEPLPFGQYFDMAKLAKAMRKSRHEVVQLDHPDLLQFVNALVTGTRILMFLGYAPGSLLGGNKSSRILMVWYMHKTIRVGAHFQPHASEMLKLLLHQQQTQKEILEVWVSCCFHVLGPARCCHGPSTASSSTRPGCAS